MINSREYSSSLYSNTSRNKCKNYASPQIKADGDCSHEVKRQLLLRRKAMTNLESILKNRDITLSTKVCIVKAMAFP